MEYKRDSYKYTVTLTAPTVTVDAIDYLTLCDYRVIIDPKQYKGVETPERLYEILIDSFESLRRECDLFLEKDPAQNIIYLRITVTSYMYEVKIVEVLRPVKELNEIHMLNNKLEWFNETIKQYQQRITTLESEMQGIREYLPWLRLWKSWVPSACGANPPDNMPRSVPQVSTIDISENILSLQGDCFVYLDRYPNYPVHDLLALYNPTELKISGQNAMNGRMKPFIETNILRMTNLKKIVIQQVPITSIKAVAELPNIAELVLRGCKQIRNLEKLANTKSLKVLNVTADIDTGVFAGGVHFVINIVS